MHSASREGGLLIDFGGTLDADGLPWSDRFFHLYRDGGGKLERVAFDPLFAEADERLARIEGVAEFDYSRTVEAEVDLLGDLVPDAKGAFGNGAAARFVADAKSVATRNRVVLEQLATEWRLAVVSNYQGNLEPCLAELGLDDLFDVKSDSDRVGSRKPDRQIFDSTLAALGLGARECWMIGDSPRNDIVAAGALGMRTCWMAPAARPTVGIAPTARISRLDQLPGVLGA